MRYVASLLRVAWVIAYVMLIALAAVALPVTCYCGQQTPGPRALMVAADRLPVFEPTANYSQLLGELTGVDLEQTEGSHLREMPTTFELGLAAVALSITLGVTLALPRSPSPLSATRQLLGRLVHPTTPPPQLSVIS